MIDYDGRSRWFKTATVTSWRSFYLMSINCFMGKTKTGGGDKILPRHVFHTLFARIVSWPRDTPAKMPSGALTGEWRLHKELPS
jgi:hypothetical protein